MVKLLTKILLLTQTLTFAFKDSDGISNSILNAFRFQKLRSYFIFYTFLGSTDKRGLRAGNVGFGSNATEGAHVIDNSLWKGWECINTRSSCRILLLLSHLHCHGVRLFMHYSLVDSLSNSALFRYTGICVNTALGCCPSNACYIWICLTYLSSRLLQVELLHQIFVPVPRVSNAVRNLIASHLLGLGNACKRVSVLLKVC